MEGIAERLDVNLYDVLLIVGGDSSLRDVLNSFWTKAGRPDVQSKDFSWPVFAIIPVGTVNDLSINWYGSSSLHSAIAAVLLGDSKKLQLMQLQSKESNSGAKLNKLGIGCVAYGVSVDVLDNFVSVLDNCHCLIKFLYGFGSTLAQHAEPFRALIKLTLSDCEEDVELDLKLRDLMVLSNDLDLEKLTPESSWGSLFIVEANSGKIKFMKEYIAAVSAFRNRESVKKGHSVSGLVQCYSGVVRTIQVEIPEEYNEKLRKSIVNLDGDLFACQLNFQVDFHHETLPAIVIDQSSFE